ncbi:MAG: pyruvate, phosphate dikinase [Pirellulaceae bacterium]|nr:pyruvate, phosphate dikinase [Pirellulaceae bacterium]
MADVRPEAVPVVEFKQHGQGQDMELEQRTRTFACGPTVPMVVSPDSVGNKAAHLIQMAEAGLPVPAGFVITTQLCRDYMHSGDTLPDDFASLLQRDIEHIERATSLRFGGQRRPLLVSVRSGGPVSMPGMMDTILNIGLCDATVSPLIRLTGNPRFVWDSYRRLVQAYGEVVRGLPAEPFDRLLDEQTRRESVRTIRELDAFALRDVTQQFLRLYASLAGEPFPSEPLVQLTSAAEAVLRSWRSPRAVEYRRLHQIDHQLGTAVTVQAMVFGNLGGTSGSGVAFTRDPATGEHELYLDFLWNAQGEDVVSGRQAVQDGSTIRRLMPALHRQLLDVGHALERLFRDAQDFEFTVQEGQLYLLQSRTAKRTPWAALRIACDLVAEGLIDEREGLERLAEYDLNSVSMIRLASQQNRPALSVGVAASGGVAVGQIAFEPQMAVALAREGCQPILVRHDISTDDLAGLAASAGILTIQGGRTSHAAVVARQMNKVCIVGCRDLVIDANRRCRIGGESFRERDFLSLDGQAGAVYSGKLQVVAEKPAELLSVVNAWRARCQAT